VDELLDKGKTMHTMKEHLMKELNISHRDVTKCVLFSKAHPERQPEWEADIIGLADMPDVWLVGYGLDDDSTKRGWPHL